MSGGCKRLEHMKCELIPRGCLFSIDLSDIHFRDPEKVFIHISQQKIDKTKPALSVLCITNNSPCQIQISQEMLEGFNNLN